jgi:hypothetical protein
VAPRVSIGVIVLKDDLDFAVVRARLTYLFNGGGF